MSEQKIEHEITHEETIPRESEFRRFFRVLLSRGVVVFGLVIIVLLIIVAVFAPLISPYDPYKTDMVNRLARPSAEHWLGTDSSGRDTLSRMIYGSRITLLISITALTGAAVIGMSLGLIAGYFGGITYMVIMRVMDSLLAIPTLLLALIIAALLGGGLISIIIALSIALIPAYARMMCGQVVSVKQNDYILAGLALGSDNLRIMLRHILPNCFPPLIVMITMQVGNVMLSEAGLSFLGVGIKPPGASWGGMVKDGYSYLLSVPVLSFAPGIAIMLAVFSFNMVGDGLRDALDPRLRGAL